MEAPTELSPRLHASAPGAGHTGLTRPEPEAPATRLKAPVPAFPLAPPKATIAMHSAPATRAAALPHPTLTERAQSTLGHSLSQPQPTITTPPRLSSPPPASPLGRLTTPFASPDAPITTSEEPPVGSARAIVPPLQAHPDSARARANAARDTAERVWKTTARHNFQTSLEAQRDIRFTYFNGLVSDSPTILNGNSDEKIVALTFDDGPQPAGTSAVLDILKREGVPATFFVVGRYVEKHPELVLRAVAEGHEIANHTHRHLQRSTMSVAEWTQEIDRNNRAIANVLGGAPRWFRAPGCRYSFAALQAINELGMIRVDTTNNSGDWEQPNADAIVRRVLSRLAPGQVLLFHDTVPQTARALPQLLTELKKRGYRCVSLTELAQRAQATPGFEPLWCPPGQGIVVAAPAPNSRANPAIINTEVLPAADLHSPDAPQDAGATP
ncbi:MAG: peptidoglycan-N-acetylglucosamine deacetylase [Abditibacteriota bacterium]|nr:peptidoglycan-N-acetylglucosamine deacetylase [Abditibacteriota bacterium]